MFDRVYNRVGAVAFEDVREGIIVGCFARITSGAVDLFESFGGVAGEAVGSEANERAWNRIQVNCAAFAGLEVAGEQGRDEGANHIFHADRGS